MKFVCEKSKPISGDNGLHAIRRFAERAEFPAPARTGVRHGIDTTDAYVAHLLSYVDTQKLKPLKIVVNAGNGGAGPIIGKVETPLPFRFFKGGPKPGGPFPDARPRPLIEKNNAPPGGAVPR